VHRVTDRAPAGFLSKLRRLGSESLIYGLSAIVGRLLSFLLQPYYAHHFDPGENGIQSVVYSYIPIISIALYLGMDVAYMRNVSALEDGQARDRHRVFTMSMGAVAVIGGAITIIAFLLTPWLAPLTRLDARAFRFMLGIGYTDALLAVPFAHLRMTGRAIRYAVLRLLFVMASIALNIILIGRLHWGVTGIFFANIAANAGVLALLTPEVLAGLRPGLIRGASWRALWHYALPLMPATLAVMLVENGDRIVLNYLPDATARIAYGMSSKDIVGIYSFNYKLGVAMLLVVQMFRLAWIPFALQHARDEHAPQLFARVLMALMLACSVVFLAISLFLPSVAAFGPIRHYVKPQYWLGLPIVPVILAGYVFSGMYAVVTAGLYITRRTHVLAWIAGAGALLNVAICIGAAPRWGMVGVATATPAAYALMAALGAWRANRVFPVPFEWGRLAQLGAYVAVLFGADWWAHSSGLAPLSPAGVTLKLSLLAGLPILLLVTGFFRHGEMRALRRLARVNDE
jgi:O-antigen/teichoic acid export membrane protein